MKYGVWSSEHPRCGLPNFRRDTRYTIHYTAFMLVGNTFLVSGGEKSAAAVLEYLEREGIETRGNPDLYVRAYKQFGIEEARSLRSRASLRATRDRRVFVIAASDINREAQNALLKTIEEPPDGALFFFLVPNPETLLPTFRSRAQVVNFGHSKSEQTRDISVAEFLKAQPQKRLDMLKPLLEKGEDDKRDIGNILSFLAELENTLAAHPEALAPLYRARKYITDKGALVKPLLEQLALLSPRV